VVHSSVSHYSGSDGEWQIIIPDPGTLLANDVVVVYSSTINGRWNVPTPSENLWATIGGDFQQVNSRNYASEGLVRRFETNGSLTLAERTFKYFTNFINSTSQLVVVVLRGVRNSGTFVQVDIGPRAYSTFVPPTTPSPVSAARGGSGSLALSFGHTLSGTIGGPPGGWTNIIQQDNAAGVAYCEGQWFPADGTTTQSARTPSPATRGYGLIHFIAP